MGNIFYLRGEINCLFTPPFLAFSAFYLLYPATHQWHRSGIVWCAMPLQDTNKETNGVALFSRIQNDTENTLSHLHINGCCRRLFFPLLAVNFEVFPKWKFPRLLLYRLVQRYHSGESSTQWLYIALRYGWCLWQLAFQVYGMHLNAARQTNVTQGVWECNWCHCLILFFGWGCN